MKIRLSSKLVLSIVVIEMVMLTILVWNSVRLISTSHAEVLEYNLNSESELLANLLAPGLAVNDRAIVNDALSLIKNNKNIIYAEVVDLTGERVAHFGETPAVIELDTSFEQARKSGAFDILKDIGLFGQELGSLKVGYSVLYVEELIRETRFQNTLIASGELFLSIIVTLIVGYFLTKSLRQLEAGAKALARDELDHTIDLDSKDEMGDLARAFNKLASHLVTTRNELNDEHDSLEKQTDHLKNLLNGVNAIILEYDPVDNKFTYVSEEAQKLLGYPVSDWYQEKFLEAHIAVDDLDDYLLKRNLALETPGTTMIDFRFMHRNGHAVDIRSINTVNYDDSGEYICRSIFLDVTRQKKNEQRIIYLADHDALTGLYNRHRFQQELERAVEYADRFNQPSALMFIDLDQFKYINDTLGHQAGDTLLKNTADSLSAGLRKVDVLGRLGGDEFGIILPNTDSEDVRAIAEKLMLNLVEGISSVDKKETPVTASIGIVLFPEQGKVPDNLLAMADAAMYSAKEKGRNTFCFYNDEDRHIQSMQDKLQLENKIRTALEENYFVLHYQPIFDLVSREVIHYEVLLRMQDTEGELIMPSIFLEIAESFGLIREIDHWVLKKSIHVQADSMRNNNPVSLAINLSGRHFGDPDVLEWIQTYIRETGAEPSKLIFEITETAAVENTEQAGHFTDELHRLGCKIALDDFGIGFSSFHYLKHLPVDIVKLDGGFVRNLGLDDFDTIFVKAMSDMASGLNILCIAEFVEREETVTLLKELGVEMGQGYHLARPAAEFCH